MPNRKTNDPALPHFTRLYSRHKVMLQKLARVMKIKESLVIRALIERAYKKLN